MEILTQELSKLLNITIENAVELYPMLRSQFVVYKITDSINFVLFMIIVLSAIFTVVGGVTNYQNFEYRDSESSDYSFERECYKDYYRSYELLKVSISILIGSIVLNLLVGIIQYLLASDLMFWMEFVK